MIPKEDFTDVTLVIDYAYWFNYLAYLTFLAYLTYLTNLTYLVIIAKEVKIVKEVISCDISPAVGQWVSDW